MRTDNLTPITGRFCPFFKAGAIKHEALLPPLTAAQIILSCCPLWIRVLMMLMSLFRSRTGLLIDRPLCHSTFTFKIIHRIISHFVFYCVSTGTENSAVSSYFSHRCIKHESRAVWQWFPGMCLCGPAGVQSISRLTLLMNTSNHTVKYALKVTHSAFRDVRSAILYSPCASSRAAELMKGSPDSLSKGPRRRGASKWDYCLDTALKPHRINSIQQTPGHHESNCPALIRLRRRSTSKKCE